MFANRSVRYTSKTEQCFLDELPECEETRTCGDCKRDAWKWIEYWSSWSESMSKKNPSSEPGTATLLSLFVRQ